MSKPVITLAQMQGAMQQQNVTAEQVLAQYDCPEYVAAVQAQQAQVAPVAVAQVAPVAVALANFDLMAFAQTAAPSSSGSKRAPVWELSIEELRERVIVRDLQTPNKRDEANAKLRLNLAPVYVELSAYGTLADGSPIVHFVVPRANEEAAAAKLKADVMGGIHDKALLEAAQRCKESSEKKKANKATRAPVDAAAAQDALAALETQAIAETPVLSEAPTLDLGGAGGIPELGGLTLPNL